MIKPVLPARLHLRRWFALGSVLALLLGVAAVANAQGLVKGVQEGAAAGNKAAGPVGGVLGGAIGGVVGVFTGVLGVGNNGNQAPPPKEASKDASKDAKQPGGKDKDAKSAKAGKGSKASKEAKNAPQNGKDNKENKDVTVLTQTGAPQQSAEQIVANSDAYIERIKTELNLTPDQEKHWYGFSSAMHYLGHNGAERLNLRVARAKRDPPDDIIEQMRNEAQFLIDRAADQRNVADAAEPLYSSLDDKQKQVFIQEMVRLSHERGLD
ncbi:Spy/CpxP family protein refolding chaperone [Bradyrhizobium sp. 180]|uniref:Spy/CpxP family protein refolding chaperone n=1 Tax=unclassified Bradyrhizobium TaxID=2631580 RepID=UPI001FF8744D|nr:MULTISPECIES: Spy/CpxP family protein refolding chaperone [unclassified Bradyrhizobium]MCK1419190.1 Spy/CpxP family protein refolding chaperone [Bradyrhizobium sp. CW12]MCK1493444.1 Spy/CpxP family protein refolding chaperone [Bradyrhizobium sp. 180]MCK1530140.1 Spy/CpxP family protein refolding chaperone [Bradyrhizobium sp. 182]MCK1594016.1 Spy/CpxP family protein refolding chaperone [Bradyrhizobium sp. 164]MCK1619443.1 Spy/CpxP family protein refolding chaperone [Bradyrhizobium sp. 159]